MLVTIWLLLIVCGLLFPRSKILSAIMLSFMIVTIGFKTQGADYTIYENEFIWAATQDFSDVHYVGYLVLQQLAHQLGLTYAELVMWVAILSCLLLYYGLTRLTSRVNAVLALFFIYPFSHEAIQTRTFLANSLLVAALPLVLKDSKSYYLPRILLFYALAAIACTFHFEATIYVVFLSMMLFLPARFGRIYVIAGVLIAFVLIFTGILPLLLVHLNSRIAFWLSGTTKLGAIIPITITIIIWYTTQLAGKTCLRQNIEALDAQIYYQRLLRLSDYMLFLIPLFLYDITFNRLWRLFLLLMFIMVADSFNSQMSKNTKRWIIMLLVILFTSTCLYEGAFTLLFDVFENNAVIDSLALF